MRKSTVIITLTILGLVAAGFLLLREVAHFQFTRNETISSGTTASSRWPEGAAVAPHTLSYEIEGEAPLVEPVREAVEQHLDVRPAVPDETPELIIVLEETAVGWSPFRSRAEIKASALFSSNGDFDFRESRPYFFEFNADDGQDDGLIVQVAAEYEINDQSAGVISRPGYLDQLADKLAQEVANTVQTHIFAAP